MINVKKVKALIAKELLVQSKDSATLSTMVVIPLLFGIVIPVSLICLERITRWFKVWEVCSLSSTPLLLMPLVLV